MGRVIGNQPVIPVDVDVVHNQPSKDWHNEAEVMLFMRPSRWLKIDMFSHRLIRANWVVFSIASLFLWLVTLLTLVVKDVDEDGESFSRPVAEFEVWKSWIAQNFDWFYVGTQTIWIVFIAWLALSKYGTIRLGKDSDR
ncbi:hypothetical protein T484DRAFT_1791271 [Baffinella frigidus]|nr:hypothetical protein T484DRAFT_1791271 [Cryptophyta sp. CCMP2293]